MKELKVMSYPEFDERLKEVDMNFKIKQGCLISPNEQAGIEDEDRIKRQIKAECESYFNQVGDDMKAGLVVEVEGDMGKHRIEYIDELEELLHQLVYKREVE